MAALDVIPPYGFLHKPSLLWPPPAPQEILESRQHMLDRLKKKAPELVQRFQKSDETPPWATTRSDFPSQLRRSVEAGRESGPSDLGDKVEPDDVVQVISEGKTITLKDQVHLHATNKQLSHPTVSPLLTPSLAGLPPLFIVAGDDEVLRDEIVRFAHRAAHPDRYPLRSGLLGRHGNQRRLELARDKKWQPTTVHLQVYDGMCHDICLFSFIQPAKYCYRAIASFCIRMTAPRYGTQSDASAADAKDSSGSDRASHANIDTLKSKASKPSLSSVGMSRKKDKDFNRGTMYFPELPDSVSVFWCINFCC